MKLLSSLAIRPGVTSVVLAALVVTAGCNGRSKTSESSASSASSLSSAAHSSVSSSISSSESSSAFSSSVSSLSSSSMSSSSTSSETGITAKTVAKTAQWKRVQTLKTDLAYALKLDSAELCQELDSLSCFDQVHLSALGGNEPFVITQYKPVAETSAISAVAAERVALHACSNRVEQDKTQAMVFTELDLSTMAQPDNSDYLASLDRQNTLLYQRLLARDPSAEELTALHALTQDDANNPISNSDVAKLSCFVLASSSEFIFL